MTLTNPYVTGNAREEILNEVFMALAKPEANVIVLYGRRRIAKISILNELQSRLSDNGQYIVVYFDLRDKLTDLAQAVVKAVSPEQSRQDQLMSLARTEQTFYEQFLPEVLEKLPSNTSLVLLLDEFDALDIEPQPPQPEHIATIPYLRRLTTLNRQQLKLVFVVGRSDVSSKALSLFKVATTVSLEELDPQANHYYQLAKQLHTKDELENAERELDNALRNNPKHLPARLLLGEILLEKGEITQAVRKLERAYELDPSAAKSLYVRALLDLAESDSDSHPLQERWDACQRILHEIQRQDQQALETQNTLAIEFLNQAHTDEKEEKWDNAIGFYKELLRTYPIPEKRPQDKRVESWEKRLSRCQLEKIYQQAEQAWREERLDDAEELLFNILHQERNHKKANQLLNRIRKSGSIPYGLVGTAVIVLFLLIAGGFWRFYPGTGNGPPTATSTPSEVVLTVETPTGAITQPVSPTPSQSPKPSTPSATLTPTAPVATPTPTAPVATPTIVPPAIVEQRTLSGPTHSAEVFSVAFSPDGTRLVSGGGEIFSWDIDNETSEPLVDLGVNVEVFSVAFSPDGTRLASGLSNGTVCLWDVNSQQIVQECPNFSAEVQSVGFSPDGKRLAAGTSDGTVRLWDLENNTLLYERQDPGAVQSLSFTPDGRLLASGGPRGTIRLWDVESGELSKLEEPERSGWVVYSVAFSPDGLLASGSEDGTVRVWDVTSGEVRHKLSDHKRHVPSVAFSPDGQILASASWDKTVRLWNVGSGRLLQTLEHTNEVHSVAFNHDRTRLACGLKDGTIRLWSLSNP